MGGLRGAVGCAGGCQRRRDTAGGCWWFCLAQIYVQTPPGPAQRARFARPPWLDGLRAGSSSRGVAGAEGAAVLDAIGGAQRHPAGTDGRQLARGEPGSHQDQPDTACCLCARRQRRQRSQQSGGVGCGAGWGAPWPVLVVVGGVLAADRPTQGRLSARVTASTSAAPAVSACGQRQRRPQRAAPVRAQPAGAGGRGDRRCGRYEPLRQVCGRKLRVGAAPARAAEGAPAARRSGRRWRRRQLEPAIAGGPAGLARGRLGLRKIGFRSCKGANKTLYGCSN